MSTRVRSQARLVATWRDLPCGCSASDTGSWIIVRKCPAGHLELLPDAARASQWDGGIFGPYKPERDRPKWDATERA